MLRPFFSLILAALLQNPGTLHAAPTDVPVDRQGCSFATPDPDLAARACTEAIDSGRLSGQDLARAHAVRAMAHRARERFEEAISDLTAALAIEPHPSGSIERGKTYVMAFRHAQAIADFEAAAQQNPQAVKLFEEIAEWLAGQHYFAEAILYFEAGMRWRPKDSHLVRRRGDMEDYLGRQEAALAFHEAALRLDPANAAAHSSRAVALMHLRHYDRALAELDRALALQPRFAHAHYVRGRALFDVGRFDEAAGAFARTIENGRRDAYTAIWRYLALGRAGQDGGAELREHAKKLDLAAWPGPVIVLLLGTTTPEQLMERTQDADPRVTRHQRCETLFFIGEHHLLAGRPRDAAAAFEATIATGVIEFVEYWHAKRELERLGRP